jgi:hypothetical protein
VPRLTSTTSHKQRTSGLLATGCAVFIPLVFSYNFEAFMTY